MAVPDLFPLFLKLEGRRCLVVGAGRVAEGKIAGLLRCGARVRVVAPEATPAIEKAAQRKEITWIARRFRARDLAGAFLVVAATSSAQLNQRIFERAARDGILCNCVDDPAHCDFYYPAVLRRGPLQIAISTGGRAPALARALRQKLERRFGPGYGPWVEQLGRARNDLRAQPLAPAERRRQIRRLLRDTPPARLRSAAASRLRGTRRDTERSTELGTERGTRRGTQQ